MWCFFLVTSNHDDQFLSCSHAVLSHAKMASRAASSQKAPMPSSQVAYPKLSSTEATTQEDTDPDDSDEVGSLVDFIINDDADDNSDEADDHYSHSENDDEDDDEDANGDEDDGKNDSEDEEGTRISRDIDVKNIVNGKRRRVAPSRYFDELLKTSETRNLYMCDIHDDEMYAAIVAEDFSEGEGSDGYDDDGDGSDGYDDDDDVVEDTGHNKKVISKKSSKPMAV